MADILRDIHLKLFFFLIIGLLFFHPCSSLHLRVLSLADIHSSGRVHSCWKYMLLPGRHITDIFFRHRKTETPACFDFGNAKKQRLAASLHSVDLKQTGCRPFF